MSDEMRPIIGYCGHKVGALGSGLLVSVRCAECDDYVGTYWADRPPPGYPALVGTVDAAGAAEYDDAGLAALRELLDRAAEAGDSEATGE